MTAAFAELQRTYAEHRVATYPLTESKTPAIRGYDRVGPKGSQQLAVKFPTATACGFVAGPRNRITILDIDSPEERLRDDMLAKYGATPLVVLTPSGGRHCYFRHNGEKRLIRPLENVDILGAGNVVAAGSVVPKGKYRIERGTLDDLDRLPPMRRVQTIDAVSSIPKGARNDAVFKRLLREVHYCDDLEALLDSARTLNMNCMPPMSDAEVVVIAKKVWALHISGRNWVGRKARASTDREEILALSRDPGAAMLLMLVRVSHPMPDDRFAIDQIATASLLGWTPKTLRSRIKALMAMKRLKRVHYGRGKGDPHQYTLIR
jgi:hypothetical protein